MQKFRKSLYTSINKEHIRLFISLIGEENVLIDSESKQAYGQDETEDLSFQPQVIQNPKNLEEISKIMSFAMKEKSQLPQEEPEQV